MVYGNAWWSHTPDSNSYQLEELGKRLNLPEPPFPHLQNSDGDGDGGGDGDIKFI